MTIQTTCPTCGSTVDDTMKFCLTCGSKLAPAATPAPVTQECPTCPKCGAPASAGYKFCAKCGASLSPSPVSSGQFPTPDNPSTSQGDAAFAKPSPIPQPYGVGQPSDAAQSNQVLAGAGAAFASMEGGVKNFGEQSMSKIDGFMGRSVDSSAAGLGFNQAEHTLESASDTLMSDAFKFFNKAYKSSSPGEGAQPIASVVRRAEEEAEMEAQVQAQRDFSKTSGEGAHYGGFASSLSAEAMPTVAMIKGSRAQAQKNEQVARLKHKVALGETSMADAVEQSKR